MRARPAVLPAVAWAALACAGLLAVGGLTPAFTDYEAELEPSVNLLLHGDLAGCMAALPPYGASLVLRAPAALLAHALGGGGLAVFRALAIPCLVAAGALAVTQDVRLRREGRPLLDRGLLFLLIAANPLTIRALDVGHPEELLAGVLCVAATLAGLRERPLWAGLLLGAAVGAKPWAVVAAGPVLLALPSGRLLALGAGLAVAGLLEAPLAIGGHVASSATELGGRVLSGGPDAATTHLLIRENGTIFQPWQAFWFLGHAGEHIVGTFGDVKEGYRAAPGWALGGSKTIVLGAAALLSLAGWWRRARGERALALLAAILLARCLTDTWDTDYYLLPFLLALGVWEVRVRRGPPLVTLVATGAAYATTWELRPLLGPDTLSLLFLAWSLPMLAWLLAHALRLRIAAWHAPRRREWAQAPR